MLHRRRGYAAVPLLGLRRLSSSLWWFGGFFGERQHAADDVDSIGGDASAADPGESGRLQFLSGDFLGEFHRRCSSTDMKR
jgi:hypothetical protein